MGKINVVFPLMFEEITLLSKLRKEIVFNMEHAFVKGHC